MATFTSPPDFNSSESSQPRVLEAKFGDGYSQRVGDGINIRPREWALSFTNRTTAEKDTIVNFLVARNGIESFDWTPPSGATGKFLCRSWQVTPVNATMWTIQATFTEVFV